MPITTKPSKPFSNGTEYEVFQENFCERCKHGKTNEDGLPLFISEGGCKIWHVLEMARLHVLRFPSEYILEIWDGNEPKYRHVCKSFETDDPEIMEAYRQLFKEEKS